jgi:TonB family protein
VPALLDAALRSSLVLLAAIAASALLRRRSAASRHAVLAAGVCGALIVVPLGTAVPARWLFHLSPPAAVADTAPLVVTAVETSSSPSDVRFAREAAPAAAAFWLVGAGWGAGAVVGLLLMAVGLVRLARLTARAEPITGGRWRELADRVAADQAVHRPVGLAAAPVRGGPMTWGVWRPVILIPPEALSWTEARAYLVLYHEMAHVGRGDWPIQLAAELLRAVWWANPLAWIACRRLSRESELACDDAVLSAGVPAADYAAELVAIARGYARSAGPVGAVLPMARPSTLEGRVTAMLNENLNRRPLTRRVLVSVVVAVAAVIVPLTALRLSSQDSPRTLVVQIYDPTSSVLPGVEVTLEHPASGKRNAVTDSSGQLAFDGVAPGDYTIDASLMGFRRLQTPLTLRVTRDWERTITLQVSDLSETVTVAASRLPAASPAPPAGSKREPLRIGGNIRVPRKLAHVNPVYPPAMRELGLEGSVPIEAVIGTDGSVAGVRILSAQVHPDFAKAALDAVRQWKFSPTLLNGEAVEVRMAVTVRFNLLAE